MIIGIDNFNQLKELKNIKKKFQKYKYKILNLKLLIIKRNSFYLRNGNYNKDYFMCDLSKLIFNINHKKFYIRRLKLKI